MYPTNSSSPLQLFFAPVHPHSHHSPREEDAGHPDDLFACTDTGHFFTVTDLTVDISARNVNTSKSFLCPTCLTTPLTIAPPQKRKAGHPFAHCTSCSWNSSHRHIASLADLLDQSTTPFPWLFSHFRSLKSIQTSMPTSIGNHSASTARNASEQSIAARRSLHLLGVNTHKAPVQVAAAATVFTDKQASHEEHVFQSFLPPPQFAHVRGAPKSEIAAMTAPIDSNVLIAPSERRANGVFLRRQMGPRQKVRRPHVSIKTATSNRVVYTKWDAIEYNEGSIEFTAAFVLPQVTIQILARTSEENTAIDAIVCIENEKQVTAHVELFNWIQPEDRQQVAIHGGETEQMRFNSLQCAEDTDSGFMDCTAKSWSNSLVQLGMKVRYEAERDGVGVRLKRLCGPVWSVCMFGREES